MTIEYVLESCTGADRKPALDLPCQVTAADLWFAEDPRDLEQAKALCAQCPLQAECLRAALDCAAVDNRKQARSRYGAKKEKS